MKKQEGKYCVKQLIVVLLCMLLSIQMLSSAVPALLAVSEVQAEEGNEETEQPQETEQLPGSEVPADNIEGEQQEGETGQPPIQIMPLANVSVSTFADLKTALTTAGSHVITITGNIQFPQVIVVPSTTTAVLLWDGTSKPLTLASGYTGRHFSVAGNLTLGTGIVLNGSDPASPSDALGGGITVEGTGELTINGGTIEKCWAVYNGGGVEVKANGKMNFSQGKISECKAMRNGGGYGGGIYFEGPNTFHMSGGAVIEKCVAHYGGGVYVKNGAFNLSDNAYISGCLTQKASGTTPTDFPHGGGVCVDAATFTMTGSSQIKDCISGNHGGGIYSNGSGVVILGTGADNPQVSKCIAYDDPANGTGSDPGNGGGILSSGVLIINSGTIENCSAVNNGGGVYLDPDAQQDFRMLGGLIKGCKAANGGGVRQVPNTKATMTGGTIEACNAIYYGGGIAMSGGTLAIQAASSANPPQLKNCSVIGKASGWYAAQGGGIYISNGMADIAGAEILGCWAETTSSATNIHGSGGGIFVGSAGKCKLDNTTISGCRAKFHGGGIFTKDYNNLTTTNSVKFSGNTAVFSRIPADTVASSGYPCINSALRSLTDAALEGRPYPLNNYDINYLSYTVIYDANGGVDSLTSKTDYKTVVELTPFVNADSMEPANSNDTASFQTLPNERSANGGSFEFTKAGTEFGSWDYRTYYVGGATYYQPYPVGSTNVLSRNKLLETNQPTWKAYALWTKDLKITKKVDGAYGDLTKEFDITVSIKDHDWKAVGAAQTVSLKHNESYIIQDVYEDCRVTVAEQASSANGYTIKYYDGTNRTSSYSSVQQKAYTQLEVEVVVENTRKPVVISGVTIGSGSEMLLFVSSCGVLLFAGYSVWRRRRLVDRKKNG